MNIEKYQEDLFSLDWEDIYTRLMAYTLYKIAPFYFKHGINKREIAKDAIQDSIDKLLSRTTDWNRERYPNALEKLKSMIDTYFVNIWKNKNYKDKISAESPISDSDSELTLKDTFSNDNKSILNSLEYDEAYNNYIDKCFDLLAHEEDIIFDVFAEMTTGKQNKEIANSLNVDIRTVENAKKIIRRKLSKIKLELTTKDEA